MPLDARPPQTPADLIAWAFDYRARLLAEGDRWFALGRGARAVEFYIEAGEIGRIYDLDGTPHAPPPMTPAERVRRTRAHFAKQRT